MSACQPRARRPPAELLHRAPELDLFCFALFPPPERPPAFVVSPLLRCVRARRRPFYDKRTRLYAAESLCDARLQSGGTATSPKMLLLSAMNVCRAKQNGKVAAGFCACIACMAFCTRALTHQLCVVGSSTKQDEVHDDRVASVSPVLPKRHC